jgi:tryptophan halogenase
MSSRQNNDKKLHRIAIVGGGTAGWMSAAALSKVLSPEDYTILLIESAEIPSIGVGEATIPPIESFNKLLGIEFSELLRATKGTLKLGIEFINWGNIGDSYLHPFGTYGPDFHNLPFHHYWQRAYSKGLCKPLETYSINARMASQKKFIEPQDITNSPLAKIGYAFHFDASLYAKYLRGYCEKRGVQRIEGNVVGSKLDQKNGYIQTLILQNQECIDADFFIDCSGFKGLLIEEALQTGYDDWSHYLPCNSAQAVPSERLAPLPSHTKSIAHGFGWQWRIPLQHRTGNGLVYSDSFCSDEMAEKTLRSNLETRQLADIRQLRFNSGKRHKAWNRNCLSVGLASGFLEPLESTSIHLIQSTLSKFIGLFPRFDNFESEQKRFNRLVHDEMVAIRDFIILHYKATERTDTEFWKYCKNMAIPDSLGEKIELYKSSSLLYRDNHELFAENSWLAVLDGQNVKPRGYNPLADSMPTTELIERLELIDNVIGKCVVSMPSHDDFLKHRLK